jgi:hypothetical protein
MRLFSALFDDSTLVVMGALYTYVYANGSNRHTFGLTMPTSTSLALVMNKEVDC